MSTTRRPAAGRRRYTHGPHCYLRGSIWYAWIPADGDQPPIDRSTHQRDRRDADRVLAELLAGRRTPSTLAGPASESTLLQIVEAYLAAPHGWRDRTADTCENRAMAWLRWCSERGIALPSQTKGEDARAWVAHLLQRKASTANRSIIIVRRMMRWASHPDRGHCLETPWHRLEQLREDRRASAPLIPSPREVERVVTWLATESLRCAAGTKMQHRRAASWRLGALFTACALGTGMRIDELATVPTTNLHLGALVVPPSKGHAERTLPLPAETEQALRELFALRGHAQAPNGQTLVVNEHWALRVLERGCAATKVPRFTPHDLRRTFATECRRAGLPVTLIRDLMGHKDTGTTEGYFGRYRDDAAVKVPLPSALAILTSPPPANVVPFVSRK